MVRHLRVRVGAHLVLLRRHVRRARLTPERVHVAFGVAPHLHRGAPHEGEEHGGELELGRQLLRRENRVRHHLARFRHQLHAQAGEAVRMLFEVRLPDGQLRGAGLEDDRVARPRVGHGGGRRDQNVDLAVGAELELVDVRLCLRPRAASHRTLPERRAEGHAEVGALAPGAQEAVGPGVVEHAERVVHVGVVDQELLVLVLEVEELRVQRVRLLHDPVEDQPGQAGHPAVALGQVDVGLGHPGGLADHIERRRLCLDPGVERCIQPVVLHPQDATHVSTEFPVLGAPGNFGL